MYIVKLFVCLVVLCSALSPGTHYICDVEDLAGHGVFIVIGCRGEPEFLEGLVHKFLKKKAVQHFEICKQRQVTFGSPAMYPFTHETQAFTDADRYTP